MRKIYFSVFGSGIGHITRVHDIAENLRHPGDQFVYSSFDDGIEYLERSGEKAVLRSPTVDVFKWNESGGLYARGSFLSFPLAVPSFYDQIRFEIKNLQKFDPKLVVSESRLSAIIAARLKSYPVVTILNQFRVLFPPRFRNKVLSGFYERRVGAGLGLLWSLSDKVLMPDLPPPYTIGEANVAGSDLRDKVTFVGFMTPNGSTPAMLESARTALDLDHRPLVFIQISGPNATKQKFVKDALAATDMLSKKFNVVVSLGYPNGSTIPSRLSNGSWVYEWCPIKDELFILSDVVVGRSGHRTIEHCFDGGKPGVLVPVHNHSEQLGNAEKFTKMGLGIEIKSEQLTSKRLIESVDECLNDSKYRKNIENVQRVSKRYDGIARTVEVINSYL